MTIPDYTTPTHVVANSQLDSDKFNAETVDNIGFLSAAKVGRLGMVAGLVVPDNTWVSVEWDFAAYETVPMWAVSPYPERVAPSVAGLWQVNCRIQWPAATASIAVRLQLNGVTLLDQDTRTALPGHTSNTSLGTIAEVDGIGDYVNVHVWQDSGGSITIPGLGHHFLDLVWLGG